MHPRGSPAINLVAISIYSRALAPEGLSSSANGMLSDPGHVSYSEIAWEHNVDSDTGASCPAPFSQLI